MWFLAEGSSGPTSHSECVQMERLGDQIFQKGLDYVACSSLSNKLHRNELHLQWLSHISICLGQYPSTFVLNELVLRVVLHESDWQRQTHLNQHEKFRTVHSDQGDRTKAKNECEPGNFTWFSFQTQNTDFRPFFFGQICGRYFFNSTACFSSLDGPFNLL